jgi:Fic family protein
MVPIFKEIDALQQEINQRRSFDPHELAQIKEYYRIGFTYSTNALEGNSLTETETKIVLEDGITIGGKRLVDHFEVVGHGQAYDYMYTLINGTPLSEDDLKQLHHLFYYRIDEAQAGVYRSVKVFIHMTRKPRFFQSRG